MIIIADSGSTKTDWCVVNHGKQVKRITTEGTNPFFQTEEEISQVVKDKLMPHLDGVKIDAVYFYGAGCAFPEKNEIVHNAIYRHIPVTIEVGSDLLAAARSLCRHEAGIACIMGTGSNSCYYDGKEIVNNISPLGYILGDEGSGAVLGKLLVGDCLKNQLTPELKEKFFNRFNLTPKEILDNVYKKPFPNRFLASVSPFLIENIEEPCIHRIVLNGFKNFFTRNVMQYDYKNVKVHFIGSIAYYYKEVLEEAALALAPLQELVLNGVAQLVALAVGQAADELIVVIDDDDGDDRARSVILQPDLFIIRDIDPVGDAHVAGGIVRIRAHEVAVDLILMALILQQLRALGIALEQPAAGKLRDHVRDAHIDRRLVPAAEIEKVLVGPDDLRICRTKDRHRQREILQGIISCRLRIIGDGFNISFERAALARAHDDRINDEQQNDDALADRQPEPVGKEERDDCKHDQKQQKHPRIGHQRPLQLGFIGYIADFGVSHRHTSLHPAGQKLLPL